MRAFLAEQPLLVLVVVLAAGSAIGGLRVRGISLGPAGALFAGLALSAWHPALADVVPALLGTLGLTLFAYTIGLAGGPSFFAGFRQTAPMMLLAVAVVAGVAVLAWLLGNAWGLSPGEIAGTYAGAMTNTPGLAAATDITGTTEPVVGYSLAYPFGVLGVLAAITFGLALSRRSPTREDREPPQPATHLTVEVTRAGLPPLGDLATYDGAELVFSRVRRGEQERTPSPTLLLQPGDLLTAIGPRDPLHAFADWVGRRTARDLPLDRSQVDFQWAVLSNPAYAGARIADLGLERFDAVVGYVRRGDVELVATSDFVLELGDRVRVVAPRAKIARAVAEVGDSERAATLVQPGGFAAGLGLGLALGTVPIPLPGATVELGAAAGPLLVGLVLGRVGRSGPIVWQIPYATNQALRQIGVLLFLAVVGLSAGPEFAAALASPRGFTLLGFGALLTTVAAAALLLLARIQRLSGARLAGVLAGTQNQPAILSFAADRAGHDPRVQIAYALLFPPTFVAKILAAQLLASL